MHLTGLSVHYRLVSLLGITAKMIKLELPEPIHRLLVILIRTVP